MYRPSFLLLFLIFHVSVDARTSWTISGNFICPIQPWFQYHLVVKEDDGWCPWCWAKGISHEGLSFSNYPHQYTIDAWDDDDAGKEFELFFRITHNCTTYGNRLLIDYIPIGDFPIDGNHHDVHKDLDIVNKGVPTTDLFVKI